MTSSEIRDDLFVLFEQIDDAVGASLERTIAKANIKMMAEIAAQLYNLSETIRIKELRAEVNLYESQAERQDWA